MPDEYSPYTYRGENRAPPHHTTCYSVDDAVTLLQHHAAQNWENVEDLQDHLSAIAIDLNHIGRGVSQLEYGVREPRGDE